MSTDAGTFDGTGWSLRAERRRTPDGRAAVGLTGGVSSGKTTALRFFAEFGARVISADALVHELYERAEVRMAIHARFGDRAVGPQGTVDRAALAAIVTQDEQEMLALEALVHPRVLHDINRFIAEAPPGSVVVCEVPLLVDVSAQSLFDLVVTIEAPVDVRRTWAAGRLPTGVFDRLDGRLVGEAARAAAADAVYQNVGSIEGLRAFCATIFERARIMASEELWDVLESP
ncbi:MAG: dephospho-CoA kinase [Thermoleophilia bacterium]